MQTSASKSCAWVISSIESAITSREISDARMPGVACDWLSETAIVLNGSATPPAAATPSAARADSSRCVRLHGIVPVHVEAMPTIGLSSRAGSMPIARKCARAPARSAPEASAARARRRRASWLTDARIRRGLGAQHDFERGAASRSRAEREAALDRRRAGAHVLQALARRRLGAVEAVAVVGDRDETLAERPLADRHLRPGRVRVLADVGEALLHDAEDLDLLVGGEADRAVDLELDVELAVRGEELDVPPQGCVEGGGAARGRQREDREARLLLRELRRLLQPRRDLLERCARFEHRRVRRHGEQVLRETVVDLPRDARALFRDSAAKLCEADRAPRADEDERVREHPQEVALGHRRTGEERLEDEVERGEEHQREAEREPAREVVLTCSEPLAPADDADEAHERLQRERAREVERRLVAVVGRRVRQRRTERTQQRPRDEQSDAGREHRIRDRPVAVLRASAQEGRRRDQREAEHAAEQRGPALRGADLLAAELRADREHEGGERRDEEPAREQEVDAPALDREADGREQRHEQAREPHGRLEDEPELREVPLGLEAGVREEEREARAEEPGQQDLAQEPGLVLVAILLHLPLVGRTIRADKG